MKASFKIGTEAWGAGEFAARAELLQRYLGMAAARAITHRGIYASEAATLLRLMAELKLDLEAGLANLEPENLDGEKGGR